MKPLDRSEEQLLADAQSHRDTACVIHIADLTQARVGAGAGLLGGRPTLALGSGNVISQGKLEYVMCAAMALPMIAGLFTMAMEALGR